MIGKITDEHSMQAIVSQGILPAIACAMRADETTDVKVAVIGNLVNTYNEFFMTGRSVTTKEQNNE